MGWTSCGLAAKEVLVTGVILPWDDGAGEAIGVTLGFHVEPPLCKVNSYDVPACTITSWASL